MNEREFETSSSRPGSPAPSEGARHTGPIDRGRAAGHAARALGIPRPSFAKLTRRGVPAACLSELLRRSSGDQAGRSRTPTLRRR